jgi:DNA gyrase/topoisomerase IV subunit B
MRIEKNMRACRAAHGKAKTARATYVERVEKKMCGSHAERMKEKICATLGSIITKEEKRRPCMVSIGKNERDKARSTCAEHGSSLKRKWECRPCTAGISKGEQS